MAVKLNRRAYEHAKALIGEGRFEFDERDAWSEHQPSALEESEYIRLHGFAEYGKWYLGVDDERPENTKGHYEFPFGDFRKVHRCGVLAAESRAGQYRHYDIETSAAHLHGMMEAARPRRRIRRRLLQAQRRMGPDTPGGRGKPDAVSAVRDRKN
jgi:hypothetical protein